MRFCCPNNACKGAPYYRMGKYKTKWNHQPVPRYQCQSCYISFSTHTNRSTYRQKRPDLNMKVFRLYCSGMTQRRIAKELQCNLKTVVRKMLFLAKEGFNAHEKMLKKWQGKIESVQFDEMESFEHTRLKPLNIPLAVTGDGEKILGISVGTLHYKGRLAPLAYKKYGPRKDTSQKARLRVLKLVKKVSAPHLSMVSDAKPEYATEFQNTFSNICHTAVPNRKNQTMFVTNPTRRKNIDDPLFWLNHVAARIRQDLSRMMRKTWTTTKRPDRLEAHLVLFIAYYNQYFI